MISAHSTYDTMRHLADSAGLVAMVVFFAIFALWPFRPGAKERNQAAANMIFEEDDNG